MPYDEGDFRSSSWWSEKHKCWVPSTMGCNDQAYERRLREDKQLVAFWKKHDIMKQ